MKSISPNLRNANLHHNTSTKIFYEHGLSEAWFPMYGHLKFKAVGQSVHLELKSTVLHTRTVTADSLTISRIVQIVSNQFLVSSYTSWKSMTSVA